MGRSFLKPLLMTCAALAGANGSAQELDKNAKSVLFVVDHSGSMMGELAKVQSAVTALSRRIDMTVNAGLLSFHGCGPETIDYKVPMGKRNGGRIAQAVGSLEAMGATDIQGALQMAAQIQAEQGVCAQILLFTDNFDTCSLSSDQVPTVSGSSCAEVNVITSSSDEVLVGYFAEVATTSGGSVFSGQRTVRDIMKTIEKILAKRGVSRDISVGSNTDPDEQPGDKREKPTETKKKKEKKKKAKKEVGSETSKELNGDDN